MSKEQVIKVGLILLAGLSLGLLSGYLLFYRPAESPDSALGEDFELFDTADAEEPTPEGAHRDASIQMPGESTAFPEKAALLLPSQPTASPPKDLCLSVEGAVRKPGVYCFEKDSRVNDAVRAAGGLLENADLSDINLAAWVLDNVPLYIPFQRMVHKEEQRIVARQTPAASQMNPPHYTRSGWFSVYRHASSSDLPSHGESASQPVQATPSLPSGRDSSGKINLNLATTAQLESLPGIGPKTAAQIEAYREHQPFASVEELQQVHGIGPKKLEAVRDLVTVE